MPILSTEHHSMLLRIDEAFNETSNVMEELDSLIEQKRRLQIDIDVKREQLQETFVPLLCMVTVDVLLFKGRKNKIPLIRLHRKIHGCGLSESKNAVEAFIEAYLG